MEWIRRIVKTPIEPEDKDVFWLDISVPNYAVLKYYENGEWKIVRHSEDGIAYILPVDGIPYSDLSQDVKNRIDLAKEQSDWNQSNESAVDYIKNKPNVAAKADKVESATAGNLASLDEEGNIADSGISKNFIEDNYQHLYHCTLQEVLNPKDGDICIVPVSYDNIPITGTDDSNIFNFTSVNRKVKWRVTNGAEEWFFFRWTSDSEEVITTPSLPENVTGFPIEGIVDITNSTGEAALIWDTEFRSSVQYLTLYDVVPETAYLYIAQDWVKLEDLNKKGPDNVQQIYNSPLSEVTNPKEGDICVPPPTLTPYPIPTEYSEDYYDIPVDSQEVIITKKTDRPVDRWSETEFTITGYTKAGIDDYGTDLDALEMTFPYTHHFHFMPGAGNAAFMTILPRDICEYLSFSRIASVPYIYHNGEWIQYVQLSAEEKASLELNIKHALSVAEEAYHLPDGGIPSNDLSSSVRESLNKANTAYQKPYTGIPETDLSQGVRETLREAANAQKTTFDSGSGSFPIGSVNPGDVYTIYDGVRRMDLDYFALGEDEVGYYIYVGKKAIRVYGTAYDANNKLEGMALDGQWQTIANIPQGSYSYNVSQYEMLRISNSTMEYYNATVYIEYGIGEYVYRSGIWMPMNSTEDQLHLIEKYYEWDAKYTKPANGIPVSDIADGVIPDVSNFITKSVNDLVNYYTKTQTYTKDEVAALIGAIQQFHYEIYASTSAVTNPQGNVLYLIGPTGTGEDRYEEYVYTNNTWTKIGDTSIDLSDYVTTTALNTALAGKQDVINDLATIRSGAAAGATAYQKPQYGIPESDLDYSVTEKMREKVQFNSLPSSDMTSVDDLDDIGLSRNDLLNLADGNASALIYNQDIEYGMSESDYAQTECIIKKASRIVGDRNNKCELIFVFSGYEYAITADYNTRVATVTVTAVQDITNKADKVSEATNGHLAALDGNGNLVDSGKSASDFAVEANPTVPSGTTPGTMETIKIGSQYYELGGGTIDAEDYSGVAPVIVNPSNYYTKAETEELVETPVASTQPSGGFLPNVIYDLGELSGSVTFALATPTDNTIANTYMWTFETGSTAPTIVWPSNLTWLGGNAPTINTGKHYEITIRKGYANCLEF